MDDIVLSLRNITKYYPGVIALKDFSIDFHRGESHALLGENGAGKSTLIKIMSGAIKPDFGQIIIGTNEYKEMTPAESKANGIEVIYQEFNLIETLSAAENIALGDHKRLFVDFNLMDLNASRIFHEFNMSLNPKALVRDLTPAQQQIVEISKAIIKNVRILIMDEPTAPLTTEEVEHLFKLINKMKEKGVTIIYISHRIDEIFTICDRVTVMRDGQYINTNVVKETNRNELINLMVGRVLKENYPPSTSHFEDVAIEIRKLSGNGCRDISFSVRSGEVFGLCGLVGAGRTELVRVIYGVEKKESGDILVHGKRVSITSPVDAIRYGIGLIPEDRKTQGCFLDMDILWNTSIMSIKRFSHKGFVSNKKVTQNAKHYKELLNIKAHNLNFKVSTLSGGNQQKVVLAKTLAAQCEILIFDEPTRGIDVGAKQEIYHLMRDLANQGKAIIMISSEMEELMGMSDRIGVISEGRLVGELFKDQFNQETLLQMASTN